MTLSERLTFLKASKDAGSNNEYLNKNLGFKSFYLIDVLWFLSKKGNSFNNCCGFMFHAKNTITNVFMFVILFKLYQF